jgi:restriction system protein
MKGTWFCTDCKSEIPDEAPNCDHRSRKPCPACGSLERTHLVFGIDSAAADRATIHSVSAADHATFRDSLSLFLESLPTLVTQALILPESKTAEGILISAATIAWRKILDLLIPDPSLAFRIDPWKWEQIIAASYKESGLFDEVILTPRSGDGGKDVVATKKGVGSIKYVESVKRYTPGHVVTADEVRSLGFVMLADSDSTKGIVSTTWEFAPRIEQDRLIRKYMPDRLELLNGAKLIERLKAWGM